MTGGASRAWLDAYLFTHARQQSPYVTQSPDSFIRSLMRVPGIDASYQRWADYFLATDPGRIAELQVDRPTPSGRTPTTLQDLMTGTGTGQRRAIASTERYGFESMFNTLFSPIERRRLAHRGSAHRFLPADQRAADQYGFESLYGTGALFDDYYRAALTNRGSRVQRTSGGGGGRSRGGRRGASVQGGFKTAGVVCRIRKRCWYASGGI